MAMDLNSVKTLNAAIAMVPNLPTRMVAATHAMMFEGLILIWAGWSKRIRSSSEFNISTWMISWLLMHNIFSRCVREGWLERAATQSQEGCNMHGTILMNRVQGNFHFSPGKAVSYGSQHIHDVRTYLATNHDFQHEIHHLWFGDQKEYTAQLQKRTQAQGLTNPLDNTKYGLADRKCQIYS